MNYKKELKRFIARDPHFSYRRSDKFETIAYLRGNLTQARSKSLEGLRKTARVFLRENADLFGKDSFEKLEVLVEGKDPNGGTDIVYQQFHGRSRVYSCSINFHFSRKGILDTVRSSLNPKLASVPRAPKITAEAAAKRAERKLRPSKLIEVKGTLCYYFKGKTYLVWEVHLRGLEPSEKGVPAHWVAYVDAVTGRIIDYYDNIQTAAASIGWGTGQYSGGPQQINTSDTGVVGAVDRYQLLDVTRALVLGGGPVIRTNDVHGTPMQPSDDANNQWLDLTTTPREQNQGAEIDAHIYAGKVADYLKLAFVRNGWDDQNSDFISQVHEGLSLESSYWDFGSAHFGDGKGYTWARYDYLCCDDIVAHEFGHGLVQTTCGLDYHQTEPGALNESFCDFLASLVTNDWLIGQLCWRSPAASYPAPAVRNMEDPTNGGHWVPNPPVYEGHQPSHMSQFVPGGDPHINSGIINQFFYLLTHGGIHSLSNISVTGLGKSVMEQLFYRTITFKLAGNPNADFLKFRQAMLDACLDFYPADLFKLTQVKKAFHAVGIGPDVYIRDQLSDSGEEPNLNMSFDSPDIMNSYGSSTIDMTDLNVTSSLPLEAGQTNIASVRMQNRGYSDPNFPTPINLANPLVNIYLMPATSFGPFSSWIYMGPADLGWSSPWFAPGMVPSLDLAIPKESLPPLGHYCMIAVVNDSLDPVPNPNQIATISDYLDFVSNTNNVAYRNMEVVNFLPDVFKWHEFTIGHMGSVAIRYDISFDLDSFVPGATFYFRGPRKIFDGTNVRGFKLIERDKNDNIYEALIGNELTKQQKFTPGRKGVRNTVTYGFEDLLTNKDFKIKIGYKMPSKGVFKKLGKRRLKEGFQFAMRQFYEDKLLGSVGLKFRQDALELIRDSGRLQAKE